MRPLRPLKRRMSYEVVRRFPSSAALNPETQIGFVFKLAVAGDQRSLAVATQDRAIRLIDLERLAIVSQIAPAHDATITDIQAVPVSVAGNSTTFCSSSNDGTCKIWDLRQQAPVITVKVSNDSYLSPSRGLARCRADRRFPCSNSSIGRNSSSTQRAISTPFLACRFRDILVRRISLCLAATTEWSMCTIRPIW